MDRANHAGKGYGVHPTGSEGVAGTDGNREGYFGYVIWGAAFGSLVTSVLWAVVINL